MPKGGLHGIEPEVARAVRGGVPLGLMTELLEYTPDLRDMFGRVAAASIGWDGSDPYRDPSNG